MHKTILIVAGGTGGHIFPALALANKLKTHYNIIWLGTKKGMESRIVTNYPIHYITAVGIRGKNIKALILAPFKLLYATMQTMYIIYKHKADCVVAFGGFVGGIGGIGSILTLTPLLIHEQNSISGTSNKYLNRLTKHTFTAFDNVLPNATVVGNPIMWNALPKENLTYAKPHPTLLIIGGSLGAKTFNTLIPTLDFKGHIIHQTGEKNYDEVKRAYANSTLSVDVIAFISDMPSYYAKADIVICRAGAMTISELIKTTSVAVLIPFPYAIDNHQYHNAKILESKKCAILIQEQELSKNSLEFTLSTLDKDTIHTMQNNYQVFDTQNTEGLIQEYIDTLLSSK